MINIPQLLSEEIGLQSTQAANALLLRSEGGTIPFIARYRKERTGEMTETQLRDLFDRYDYLTELEERKAVILQSIEEQGKLTPELRTQIEASLQKNELEDLYLPYKPKRRTRATAAREKGLEPLALFIKERNIPETKRINLEKEAEKYISEEKGVATAEEALQGAADIIAEEVSEKAELRAAVRKYFSEQGVFVSTISDDFPLGSTKYEMYRNFKVKVPDIAPHNMLAMRRGESENIVSFSLVFDELYVQSFLEQQEIHTSCETLKQFYSELIHDAFERLMKITLIAEVRAEKKEIADFESIKTFESNLRQLLLTSPAGMKTTIGVDPGFRTGCKVVVISNTGMFLEYHAVYPHQSADARTAAGKTILSLIKKFKAELIAVGNGTAGRETEEFLREILHSLDNKPVIVIVNESGASVYSASKVAVEEFPDQDITVRGAVSIGRRLQDPLAELVKIDPKSIGVGQYQHDVDQKLLKKKLDETVESCVNYVGVDLNTASKELLSYVAGLNAAVAKNIISYRNENGAFTNRRELMEVPKFGPKAFEQSAGFLRIRNGGNPLDNTAVHPESYPIVEIMAHDLGLTITEITRSAEKIRTINLKKYITGTIGEPTLRDICAELQKPGRDPREEFRYAVFKEGIKEIKDLSPGMVLEGIVTNVANFGAFVDIGVHQDGLVHLSQLADRFVDDPKKIVKVGQIVSVRVLEVNESLSRIGLSMKSQGGLPSGQTVKKEIIKKDKDSFSLDDLKNKFNTKR